MKLLKYTASTMGALAILCSGCVSYKEPPAVIYADNYTSKTTDQHRAVPKDFTVLTVDQAIQAALANNPTYKQARLAIISAWATYDQKLAIFSPWVTSGISASTTDRNVYGNGANLSNQGNYYTSGANLTTSYTIFNGLMDVNNALASLANARSNEQLERMARITLIYQVIQAYNAVLLDKANIKINLSNQEFNMQQYKDTQLKYDAGASSLDEVLNFKIQTNSAQVSVIQSKQKYETDRYALAALMGLTTSTLPENVEFPDLKLDDSAQYTLGVDFYLDLAINQRPDLKSNKELLKQAKYQLYAAWGSFSPTMTVGEAYQYSGGDNYRSGSMIPTRLSTPNQYNQWVTSWSTAWTLWDGGSRIAQVRGAQANYDTYKEKLLGSWITVVQNVRSAYTNLVASIAIAKIWQETLVMSQQQRDLVREEYNAGNVDITRLNNVQSTLIQNEGNLALYITAVATNKAALDAATGVRD